MIHVAVQPEPPSFDKKVRRKGLAWLEKKDIPLDHPLPPKSNIEPYWRHCLDDLYEAYDGCCAYLAVFFERVTGGGSVDHFVAKSQRADLAFEWKNYRLACSRMNSRKRACDDVLDPFEIKNGWFGLELVSGRIYPNSALSDELKTSVQTTIDRLGLDDSGNREIRARHYQEYLEGLYTEEFLRKRSPFVWSEAKRKNLL
jgi:hypothetical protein